MKWTPIIRIGFLVVYNTIENRTHHKIQNNAVINKIWQCTILVPALLKTAAIKTQVMQNSFAFTIFQQHPSICGNQIFLAPNLLPYFSVGEYSALANLWNVAHQTHLQKQWFWRGKCFWKASQSCFSIILKLSMVHYRSYDPFYFSDLKQYFRIKKSLLLNPYFLSEVSATKPVFSVCMSNLNGYFLYKGTQSFYKIIICHMKSEVII